MSANNDTIQKTVIVTVLLCLVCSIVVSSAAVFLKPAQTENKKLSMQRSILEIAGLMEEGSSVKEQFKQIKTKIVDLRTGKFTDEVDAQAYEQRSAAKNPKLSTVLSGEQDIASIKRRAHYATVYLVEKQGKVDKLILPVHGYGLWSTMYGFLALQGDTKTVVGLGFYDHGETPGLGGEVDNPKWKAQWPGKQVFNDQFTVDIAVVKGSANPDSPKFKHQVDGLAGATLTSRGLENLLQFWLGENGFGPFLTNVRKGEA
ncbi:Na(+)-translocating NADH-quinone reductase subunit C [Spartinivicinus poritis]|uniref:Na(+)-translocating NADH-quinone reductase subunit C n=1 Tax=Spartinivicinus poritis TaxID=2994640 RepID=A0ABT5UAM1_9GAMM|nr:Na(+)-translocating NADH-quinone reductase subunit C [Spartinivicinus sp. A2-2]MDE1462597.1 Na(+)-translocating NADH-quinone reductase subunit C [Spartinivicinus sp. A2-2]